MILKRIHQIWISLKDPRPVPEHCHTFTEKWQALHPTWKYQLWGNEIFDEFSDDLWLKKLRSRPDVIDEAFVVDRLRLLVLHRFGGVYADIDTEPLRAFDPFRKPYNLVVGESAISVPQFRALQPLEVSVILAARRLSLIERLLDRPRRGGEIGHFIYEHKDEEKKVMVLPPSAFAATEATPESWALHTPHRLASWQNKNVSSEV